jgi:hypothetical protein
MNDPGLFLAGVAVTLIVTSALALLVWGAILDGREEAHQRALRRRREPSAERARSRSNVQPLTDRVPPHAA